MDVSRGFYNAPTLLSPHLGKSANPLPNPRVSRGSAPRKANDKCILYWRIFFKDIPVNDFSCNSLHFILVPVQS